jgi:hypothetical protein
MTELLAPFGAPPDAANPDAAKPHAAEPPTAVEAPARTPVLITEQEVLFATAAAMPLRQARVSRRWIEAVQAFLTTAFVKADKDRQPKRRHYPSRHDFLEDSRMAREMMRL